MIDIEHVLKPRIDALTSHSIYQKMQSLESIKKFTEWHVFAVWDFMSLVKFLQNELTCVKVPWSPPQNPEVARFINEIVFGEETDIDGQGSPKSHFEMYLEAMVELGASNKKIQQFLDALQSGMSVEQALEINQVPKAVRVFVNFTFACIESQKAHVVAAAFAFGREGIIPNVFTEILETSAGGKERYSKFIYYIERHIEVDGDSHGPLSMRMIEQLCGHDETKWKEALETAEKAVEARLALWNAIADNL